MARIGAMALLMVGAAGFAFAGRLVTPEIDATAASGALALLGGGLMVLRARRRSR